MDLEFVTPDLRRLDLFVGEVIVLPVVEGQKPPRGTLGLLDYRLAGKLSGLLARGELTGALGETYTLPLRPKLGFDRALLVGAGVAGTLNPSVFAGLVDLIAHELAQAGSRRAVVELPGRAEEEIDVELAVDILFERVGDAPLFDTWTLVETAEAMRKVTGRLRQVRANRWGLRG